MPHPVALVGVGKIARDQHIPAIAGDPDFALVAGVSRHETIDGVPNFKDIDAFLADGPEAALALCVPPSVRTAMALKALAAGRDVLLEKPPAATLGEVEAMVAAAEAAGARALRHLALALRPRGRRRPRPGSPAATVRSAHISWKEDVRRWHPGQAWIWQPAGFGVFDPGINALSILTEILPGAVHRRRGDADLSRRTATRRSRPTLGMTGRRRLPGRRPSSTGARRGRRAGTSPSRPTAAGSSCSTAAR